MRLSPQGLRKNNVVGIAKAKEEFQERRRDRKVKCSRAQGGRELVNLGSLLSSIRRRIWILVWKWVTAVCVLATQSYPIPGTVAHQAALSIEFSRQEYWSRLPSPSPGYLPNPGIEPVSLMSPALAGRFFTISATWEALEVRYLSHRKHSFNVINVLILR